MTKFLKIILAILVIAILGFAGWLIFLIKDLPDPTNFSFASVNQSTKIYDRTGKIILYEFHGEEKRTVVPFEEIPDSLKKATLAAEDSEFYNHPAFDIKAIFRAIYYNIFKREEGIQGGSTITQQLVKNTFLTPEKTLSRKVKELILAIELENKYSKDEILGFYLNQIPYGYNAYGIEAASRTYFGKSAKDLDLAESALLASLPRRPSYYNAHPDELKIRQEYILDRMVELNFISQEEADSAKAQKLNFVTTHSQIKAPHFVFYIRSLLAEIYDEKYIEEGGLKVITSLDWELQQIAEKAVADGAKRNDTNWNADNAALIAQNPKTGEILAMVGSRDFFDTEHNGNFNVALQPRQPGSSFKPFVYLKAFEKGYPPSTILFDVFTEFSANCSPEGIPFTGYSQSNCYHPQNYDRTFRGPVTLRQALAQSLNVPSVKLLYLVGIKDAITTAQSLGITTLDQDPNYYGLSLILGGGGVKLIEMVDAYSVLANNGVKISQTPILKIIDSQNNTIYENIPTETRIIDSKYVSILNDVLSDDQSRYPMFQLNGPLTIPNYKVAAKTGTSQDYRDAWTFGYSPTLVAGVWVGNNDYSPMSYGGAGGMAAAPIWNDFMKQALPKFNKEEFTPAEITPVDKPMLNGNYIIQSPTGFEIHTILYWVDKNNPLGEKPLNPYNDPQFARWEYSVSKWVSQNLGALNLINIPASTSSDLEIIEPNTEIIENDSPIKLTFKINPNLNISSIEIYFNNEFVLSLPKNNDNYYSILFKPINFQRENDLVLKVKRVEGDFEITKKLFLNP